MPAQPRQITSAWSSVDRLAGFLDDRNERCMGVSIDLGGGHAVGANGRTPRSRPARRSRSSIGGHRAPQGRHNRVGPPDHHRHVGGGLADLDHGLLDQLLQAVAAVFAEAGHHDGVVGLVVGQDPVHHTDGCEVALEVAVDPVGAESRLQRDDLGSG